MLIVFCLMYPACSMRVKRCVYSASRVRYTQTRHPRMNTHTHGRTQFKGHCHDCLSQSAVSDTLLSSSNPVSYWVTIHESIGGLAVVAFWRSPHHHGPLGSGPPRAGYSQRRKRKKKGEKGKRSPGSHSNGKRGYQARPWTHKKHPNHVFLIRYEKRP